MRKPCTHPESRKYKKVALLLPLLLQKMVAQGGCRYVAFRLFFLRCKFWFVCSSVPCWFWRVAYLHALLHAGGLFSCLGGRKAEVMQGGFYQRRKAQGLCTRCGMPAEPGFATCRACLDGLKEHRRNLASRGICIYCCREDALPGFSLCLDCAEKKEISHARYLAGLSDGKKAKKAAQSAARCKARYWESKALGVCARCHRRKASAGKAMCLDCRLKHNRMHRRRVEAREALPKHLWASHGLCTLCGKPAVEGYMSCAHHLEIRRASAAKARGEIKPGAYSYWRRLNTAAFQ